MGAAQMAVELVLDREHGLDLEQLEAPRDKLVAEAATLLRAAASVPPEAATGFREELDLLATRLSAHARGTRVRSAIALHPALARDYATAHVLLADAGWPDDELDSVLSRSLADPASSCRERQPHRELEQAWIDRLRGEGSDSTEVVARTALGTGIDPLTGSRDDVYALTHALMYATDFGAAPTALPRPPQAVLAEVRSALARALDDDDFDLAGELLMAWPFLGAPWDATASFAFRVLARVEDEAGFLPSLAIGGEEYRRQQETERAAFFAATTYHTACVMGLLCATSLRSGHRPARRLQGPPEVPTAAERLALELEEDDRRAQWQRDLRRLSPGELCHLSPFLLDVLLSRAVRRMDLGAVRHTLAVGAEAGIAASPLAAGAARLLSRVAQALPDASSTSTASAGGIE